MVLLEQLVKSREQRANPRVADIRLNEYHPEDKDEGEGEGERQRQVDELKLSSVGFADSFANRNSGYKNVQEYTRTTRGGEKKNEKKVQGSKYPGGVLPSFRHTTQHLHKLYSYMYIGLKTVLTIKVNLVEDYYYFH
ncbi:hypothetical protein KQX54_015664 [Cotesia glomerata]|uniref:Uncharacterized protein n=1 Tax=Cotesia glomerata TaxID=32391 RepID=A0AAV7IUM0_COTGL|nr:hypothetical protein KQX54_015664 [Cotesia glomerata]